MKARAKGKPKGLGAQVRITSITADPVSSNNKARAKVKLKRRR